MTTTETTQGSLATASHGCPARSQKSLFVWCESILETKHIEAASIRVA